jgi:hypothetical protein
MDDDKVKLDPEAEGEDGEEEEELEGEGFDEIIKFTIPGFILAISIGTLFDFIGWQTSAVGQWIVRTFSGEGESIFEGIYSFKKRFTRSAGSMAEAYGWGKFAGMLLPWIVDWGSRLLGVDVNGVDGFYIPFFYAMSDQMGANISGAIYLHRKEGSWSAAFKKYVRHPVMLTSLLVILIAPIGLLVVRLLGFVPSNQKYTALETIAANLCWLPPTVGWLWGRRRKQ